MISAARADELDYETEDDEYNGMGSLSYAISKVFENLPPQLSYRGLFSKIQAVMNIKSPMQHPVLEGTGIDREVFGGRFFYQKPYAEIERKEGDRLIIRSGQLAGFNDSALVGIYPSGTQDPSSAVAMATGRIIKADNFKSEVQLDKDLTVAPAQAWVFLTQPVFKLPAIGIRVADQVKIGSPAFSPSEAETIKKEISALPLVKFSKTPELVLSKGNGQDSLKLAASGYLFSLVDPSTLKEAITRYCQYTFLKTVEVNDKDANASIQLLPWVNGKIDTSQNMIGQTANAFSVGDKMVLMVRNPGTKPIYINILDLQPDGKINSILPNRSIRNPIYPDDLKIEPESERIFSNYILTVTPPTGTEVFKVFVSTQVLDLEEIAQSRGGTTRGSLSMFESLVKKSYGLQTRGMEIDNAGVGNGAAFNLVFQIKPAANK